MDKVGSLLANHELMATLPHG
jgi:hypothetical protein